MIALWEDILMEFKFTQLKDNEITLSPIFEIIQEWKCLMWNLNQSRKIKNNSSNNVWLVNSVLEFLGICYPY